MVLMRAVLPGMYNRDRSYLRGLADVRQPGEVQSRRVRPRHRGGEGTATGEVPTSKNALVDVYTAMLSDDAYRDTVASGDADLTAAAAGPRFRTRQSLESAGRLADRCARRAWSCSAAARMSIRCSRGHGIWRCCVTRPTKRVTRRSSGVNWPTPDSPSISSRSKAPTTSSRLRYLAADTRSPILFSARFGRCSRLRVAG